MTRLANNRVNHVEPWDLVLGLALKNEFLHILNYVFIELNCFHGGFRYGSHFRLRDRDLVVVEREELKVEIDFH